MIPNWLLDLNILLSRIFEFAAEVATGGILYKKGVLKNFAVSGKCRLFLIKLQAFRSTYFEEHLQRTASVFGRSLT